MRCRILNIGTDSGIHGSLRTQLEAEGLISLQHLGTEALALEILSKIPESELPHIVLVPFQLPVVATLEVIARMRSRQRFEHVRIFVWGPNIPAHQIDRIYEAGAACVLPCQFNIKHLEAMRVFCRICTADDRRKKEPRRAIAPSLLRAGEEDVRNAKLGTLFVWTACISALLWSCSFLQFGRPNMKVDLTPLPVYAAVASAGLSLMWRRAGAGADVNSPLEVKR